MVCSTSGKPPHNTKHRTTENTAQHTTPRNTQHSTEISTSGKTPHNTPVESSSQQPQQQQEQQPLTSALKKRETPSASTVNPPETEKKSSSHESKHHHHHHSSSSSLREKKRRKTADTPSEVRVLHILKKHKGSRRPSSWRNPKITATKEEAHEELQGLLEVLQEEASNPKELRATFEELARTESDCSSAKRGGDLGYFGRKKMQPAFEEASFALKKGELTKQIVDTSSGSHIILRIG